MYSTHYAVPHLRKSKGKIVVISSVAAWFCTPRLSFYNVRTTYKTSLACLTSCSLQDFLLLMNKWCLQASKAAQICFFESLRVEFGPDIGITIVTPGVIESEMTQGQLLPKVYWELKETKLEN